MNCRECETLLVEAARLASRTSVANSERSDLAAALDHAASCPACAERLSDERSVQTGLCSLAAAESQRIPTPGCEAILMAAYRTERGREVHTRRWMFAVSGAMAASLFVLLGAALVLSSESSQLVKAMSSRFGSLSAGNRGASAQQPSMLPDDVSDGSASADQEEVSDFVAFYPGADVSSLDSGALVRVRMPSSALGAFGLPVAQGSDDQWVSADLLVDEDGSPQAIRLVRPVPQSSRD